MATPTGRNAADARGFHARVRRRKKQDQSAFDALFAAPFDFGAVAPAGQSANALTLPADVEIAVQANFPTVALDIGIFDVTDPQVVFCPDAVVTSGRMNFRHLFRQPHQIRIFRSATAPAGTIVVSFRGPKSALVQFGLATFT